MVKTPKFSFVMHLTITTKIRLYQSCLQFFASEAKRRRRERLRCARELSLRSHGKKNNALEALIIIFRKITSDQKILYFGRRIQSVIFGFNRFGHEIPRNFQMATVWKNFFVSFSRISFELRIIISIALRQKMHIIQKNRLMYSLIGFEYLLVWTFTLLKKNE